LCSKLINKAFPGTINEKRLVLKKEKSKFEININHDLTIQAAKEIGCTVVNIGGEDLSSKKHHLILGLLWQIIKVIGRV
jgi:plastin-1